jgi:hypothetical protein
VKASVPMLHVYQCNFDKTVCTTPVAARMECLACGQWMRHLYSTPANTDELRALVARGVAYNPFKVDPQPWTCVRCGTEFRHIRPRYRTDGKCCQDCIDAQVPPPLLTPEECEAKQREYDERVREYDERVRDYSDRML